MSGYGNTKIGTEWRGYYITAYGIAVKHGFQGTEEEWLKSLKGDGGEPIVIRYDETAQQLQWKYESDTQWQELLSLSELQGDVVSQTLAAAQNAKTAAEAAQSAAETAAQTTGADAAAAKSGAATATEKAAAAAASAKTATDAAGEAQTAESSAKGYASTSGTNATAAAQSATDARSAKAAAETAASTATSAKTEAQTAETNAKASETAAASSKTAAATSASKAENAQSAAEDAQTAAETAASTATSAKTEAETAKTGAVSAQSKAQSAQAKAEGAAADAEESAAAAAQSATQVAANSKTAESWAVGGTGTREGEDSNNAKYWCESAQAIAGGGVTSFNGRGGIVKPQKGDYTPEMVGADASGAAAAVQSNLDGHEGDTTAHITAAERTKWNGKQDKLTFDAAPTANSTNPVTSGGVKAELDKKANATSLGAHTGNTDNPHQVTAAQTGADPAGTGKSEAASAVSAHNSSSAAHSDIRTALAGKETAGAAATVQGNLDDHEADTTKHVTAAERTAWNAKSGKAVSFTVTLAAASWSSKAQTVSNANILTGAYAYVVSPAPASFGAYSEAIIYADNVTQAGKMTFRCSQTPTAALTVNITRIEVGT
jgi:hypothetical protein